LKNRIQAHGRILQGCGAANNHAGAHGVNTSGWAPQGNRVNVARDSCGAG
jgi:hypothetical protein